MNSNEPTHTSTTGLTPGMPARHSGLRPAERVLEDLLGSEGVLAHPLRADLQRKARIDWVDIGGRTMAWRRFGDGPPLVLIHGGHGCWLHWARNIEALAQRFTVLLPDLPGFGDSDSLAEPTFENLVEATAAALDVLIGAHTPFALAGFSFGGLVAAGLAARRPSVSRLLLIGPAGHGGARRERARLQDWRIPLEQGDASGFVECMRHNLWAHMLNDAQQIDALALNIHIQSCAATRFHSKQISRSARLADEMSRIACDVFLIWGEHDVTVCLPDIGGIFSNPSVRATQIVPDSGHWVQFECAELINRQVLAWLGAPSTGLARG